MRGSFAEASGDHQWIHVDVERCKTDMPDGKTIAHGGNRHFRYQELREAPFFGAVPAEDCAGASHRAFLHAPGHFGYPLTQLLGPRACDKIFSIENKHRRASARCARDQFGV